MPDLALPPWQDSWCGTPLNPSWFARMDALEFDTILGDPHRADENLALDTTLLYRVAQGRRRPVFWLWDWSEAAVVLGSYQSVRNEIDVENAVRTDTRIVRRMSGGGAMLVEPGRTITYSVIVPESVVADMSFVQSFAFLDRWIIRGLRALGIPATYVPINDIASPYAKIGGAAQVRRAKTVLHHATLAHAMSDERLYGVLRLGRTKHNSRGIPSAVKKVSPLTHFTSLSLAEVRAWLFAAFAAQHVTHTSSFTRDELDEARERMDALYRRYDWVYRVR